MSIEASWQRHFAEMYSSLGKQAAIACAQETANLIAAMAAGARWRRRLLHAARAMRWAAEAERYRRLAKELES